MFRFAHPIYLYLLAILPVLALFYLYVVVAGKKAIKRFGDARFTTDPGSLAQTGETQILAVIHVYSRDGFYDCRPTVRL